MGKCDLDISTKAPENMGGHCIGFNTLSSDWNQKTMLIKPVLLRQQLRKGRIEPAIEKSTKKKRRSKAEKPKRQGGVFIKTENWRERVNYDS